MEAKVDRDACIGCGLCAEICPEVFEMDDEQIAIVIENPVTLDAEDEALDAEEQCPTDAISIEN